jgi:hypothetical protein
LIYVRIEVVHCFVFVDGEDVIRFDVPGFCVGSHNLLAFCGKIFGKSPDFMLGGQFGGFRRLGIVIVHRGGGLAGGA